MVLDAEQVAAAIASGCVFEPASPATVQRLSMQRKIFTVDGKPMLAGRGDGLYETVGTLQALIEQGRQLLAYLQQEPAAPEPGAPIVEESVVETLAAAVPEIVALVAEPEVPAAAATEVVLDAEQQAAPPAASVEEPIATTPDAPAKRGRGRPRGAKSRPRIPAAEAPAEAKAEADSAPPAEPEAEDASWSPAPPPRVATRPVPRPARPMPEAPRTPRRNARWLTAGAERRGRRDQHWTARQK